MGHREFERADAGSLHTTVVGSHWEIVSFGLGLQSVLLMSGGSRETEREVAVKRFTYFRRDDAIMTPNPDNGIVIEARGILEADRELDKRTGGRWQDYYLKEYPSNG